jgi:hypothetical protein
MVLSIDSIFLAVSMVALLCMQAVELYRNDH